MSAFLPSKNIFSEHDILQLMKYNFSSSKVDLKDYDLLVCCCP